MQVALARTPDFVLVQTFNTNKPQKQAGDSVVALYGIYRNHVMVISISMNLSFVTRYIYLITQVIVCNITTDMYSNEYNKMFIIHYHSSNSVC